MAKKHEINSSINGIGSVSGEIVELARLENHHWTAKSLHMCTKKYRFSAAF